MSKETPHLDHDDSEDLLHLDQQLCFALYSTLLGVNKVYRGLLRELDLTYPQYLVMLVLWEQDGLKVTDICERLYLETTTLTPLLKRLESRGLLHRRRSAQDERQVIVTLSEEGRALRQKAGELPKCMAEAMGCSAKEVADLRQRLNQIRASLFKLAE
ncbi:MarR family winged helix-turn-helix transcriptional regulator [Halomonas sp. A29]|uniref:MarR family winged helix-turn-helix transcriptional regulator n=1 Tax=Halomonas sp. A29 TaxID=3102786 RepID=UPI00398AEDEC